MAAELTIPPTREEIDLHERARALLDDPAQQGNPMREVVAELLERSEQQRSRLEKLVRISDGYHNVSRTQNIDLIREYDRQIMRLEKLARISDRYQSQLIALNDELKALTLRDPLTGVGNRRFMTERLREESERARRRGVTYALAILDVDHFKHVNDRYGHDVGDAVLCRVAETVRACLRDYDVFARWGGEEFLIALPDTTLEVARTVCERVRREIEALGVSDGAATVSVTASFGLTEHLAGENPSETVSRADVALRRAKDAGRNRLDLA